MNDAPQRISVFVTLGVAAIDMLTCAFVSTVVLFIIFIIPAPAATSEAQGARDLLGFHWSFSGSPTAILGIEIHHGDVSAVIWTDMRDADVNELCEKLSIIPSTGCVLRGANDETLASVDGMLFVSRPLKGEWSVRVIYGDTIDHADEGDAPNIIVSMTVFRRSSVTVDGISLSFDDDGTDLVSAAGGSAAAVRDVLSIE